MTMIVLLSGLVHTSIQVKPWYQVKSVGKDYNRMISPAYELTAYIGGWGCKLP